MSKEHKEKARSMLSNIRSLRTLLTALLLSTLLWPAVASMAWADRIILRNLKIISDRKVVSWNEDGVRLDNNTLLTWDEIERGKVEQNKQAEFNKMLKELGGPLFQIRQRLTKGDYEGLSEPVETVYARYLDRDSKTAYMVLQALMWSRQATGQREAAVEPYLRCYEYLRTHSDDLPGRRRLQFDAKTALSDKLQPLWFDAKAAKQALPAVRIAVAKMKKPRPAGARIYYATLAIKAGEDNLATRVLKGLDSKQLQIKELETIIQAQREILSGQPGKWLTQLENNLENFSPPNKPLAIYWLGMAKLAQKDEHIRRQGVLLMLNLPALYGEKQPELAAAGLYQSMNALGELKDLQGSVSVRKELLVRYGHTVHAGKTKQGNGTRENIKR